MFCTNIMRQASTRRFIRIRTISVAIKPGRTAWNGVKLTWCRLNSWFNRWFRRRIRRRFQRFGGYNRRRCWRWKIGWDRGGWRRSWWNVCGRYDRHGVVCFSLEAKDGIIQHKEGWLAELAGYQCADTDNVGAGLHKIGIEAPCVAAPGAGFKWKVVVWQRVRPIINFCAINGDANGRFRTIFRIHPFNC